MWGGCRFLSLSSFLPSCSDVIVAPTFFLYTFRSLWIQTEPLIKSWSASEVVCASIPEKKKWQSQKLEGARYTWSPASLKLEQMHPTGPIQGRVKTKLGLMLRCKQGRRSIIVTIRDWRLYSISIVTVWKHALSKGKLQKILVFSHTGLFSGMGLMLQHQ